MILLNYKKLKFFIRKIYEKRYIKDILKIYIIKSDSFCAFRDYIIQWYLNYIHTYINKKYNNVIIIEFQIEIDFRSQLFLFYIFFLDLFCFEF